MPKFDEMLIDQARKYGAPVSICTDSRATLLDQSNKSIRPSAMINKMPESEILNFRHGTYVTIQANVRTKIWRLHSSEKSQREKIIFKKDNPGTAFPLGRYWTPRDPNHDPMDTVRKGLALKERWNTMEVVASGTLVPPGWCYYGLAARQQGEGGVLPGGWPQMLFEQGWLAYIWDRSFG